MLSSSHTHTPAPRPPRLAQLEYQASEGPNINTFYSSSHQGELRPHHQSSQSEPEAALKDRVPEKMSQRCRWGGVGLLLQALSPRPVMAVPLCTQHYAPALHQMEPSRIQLQENKQVGSARLQRSIVSITVQTELWCNWKDI